MRFSPKKLAPIFLLSLFVGGVAYAGTYYLPNGDVTTNWTVVTSSTPAYHYSAVNDDLDGNGECGPQTQNNTYIWTGTSGTTDILTLKNGAVSTFTTTITPCVKKRHYLMATSKMRVQLIAKEGTTNQVRYSQEKVFTIPSSAGQEWVTLTPITFDFPFVNTNHATSTFQIKLKHEGNGPTRLSNIHAFVE